MQGVPDYPGKLHLGNPCQIVNGRHTFEIGGKKKGYKQISGVDDAFVVADDIEVGFKNKIPLSPFGFLY